MKWLQHLSTINHHKLLVMKHCFRCGLIRQGLFHDISKYSPAEFLVGVKYYQGYRSPNAAEKEAKGYTAAWLHHKGRNKHHMEYWIDYGPGPNDQMAGMKMPLKYVVEMFCDRVAASKTYNPETYNQHAPLEYYMKHKVHYVIHKDTEALLVKLLTMLSEQGEDTTFQYIRTNLLKQKKY